ncbi:hypothetical protein BKA62DRAFT_729465 [Auriculariales sp. MPI-PUGE-AT-0066]|nr:hypothetical protein BKA62DRAFT_729465 [Auriculariales sp. MPI-PUGE-AT-0066]
MSPSRSLVALLLAAAAHSARAQTAEGYGAYDPTQPHTVPPLPNPAPALDFPVQLDFGGNPTAGPEVAGSSLGVSIEMVLAEDIIGSSGTTVHPEFLNFVSQIKSRGGSPHWRLGGNSQELAYVVDSVEAHQPGMNTLTMVYTPAIVDAMRTVSDALDMHWYIGVTMNVTDPPRLQFVELAQQKLGDYLVTMQLGNEPDLYERKFRPNDGSYTPEVYYGEIQHMLDTMNADPLITRKNINGGPSQCNCNGDWQKIDVMSHYLDTFRSSINTVIVMEYPTNNCPGSSGAEPQDYLNSITKHTGGGRYSAVGFGGRFSDELEKAKAHDLPSGFLGVSDTFAAGMFSVDVAMQFAQNGVQHSMMHLGGQRAYYNPFVNPPANSSAPHKWTINSQGYSLLVTAEALGPSGKARVQDLKDGQPVRVMLINYMTDASGAHDFTARVSAPAGVSEVYVRYLRAESTIAKTPSGYTWAGQTYGGYFESDGIPTGEQTTETVQCVDGACPVKVPAPAVALVFLTKTNMYDAVANPAQTWSVSPGSSASPTGSDGAAGATGTAGGKTGAASSLSSNAHVGALALGGIVLGLAALLF